MRKNLIVTFIALVSTLTYADSGWNLYGKRKKTTYSSLHTTPRSYSRNFSRNSLGFYVQGGGGFSILPSNLFSSSKRKNEYGARSRSQSRKRSQSQSRSASQAPGNRDKGRKINARNLYRQQQNNPLLRSTDKFLLELPLNRSPKETLRFNPEIVGFLQGGYQWSRNFSLEAKLPIFFSTQYDHSKNNHRESILQYGKSSVGPNEVKDHYFIKYSTIGTIFSIMGKWTAPASKFVNTSFTRNLTMMIKGGGILAGAWVTEKPELKAKSIIEKDKKPIAGLDRKSPFNYYPHFYGVGGELGVIYRLNSNLSVAISANAIYPFVPKERGRTLKRERGLFSSDSDLAMPIQIGVYYKVV